MQYHPHPEHDLKVKVTALEFLCKSFVLKFYNASFCVTFIDLINIWHGDPSDSQ